MFALEFYLYGIFPMIIGLIIFLKSIQISVRKRKFLNWILLIIIFFSTLLAEYMLGIITFTNAWPTYLPHPLIGFNLILLLIQIRKNKNNIGRKNIL